MEVAPINNAGLQQVSGQFPLNKYILSVLAKKTYTITDKGECLLSDVQIPLVKDISCYDHAPKLISEDLDLYAFKLYTDIIVKGKTRHPKKVNRFIAIIQVGNTSVSIEVIGNRKLLLSKLTGLRFTTPEFIEEIPLRYDFAYGGRDVIAERKIELPPAELIKYFPDQTDLLEGSPYRYPRNPLGKGFIVELSDDSLDFLELPNLEDPRNLLSPESMVVKDPKLWYRMPLPRSTDWVTPSWFPRVAYFGLNNITEKINFNLEEINRRWAELDILSIKPLRGNVHPRCTNGASLGLQLPYIMPGEKIRLTNIHPKFTDFTLHLPPDYPNIWVDGRKGKLLPTKPVIHTIIIEPDENRLSIVWRGSGPALRPYHEEELKTMPFKVEWRK